MLMNPFQMIEYDYGVQFQGAYQATVGFGEFRSAGS